MRNAIATLALLTGSLASASAFAAREAILETAGPEEVVVETERSLDVNITGIVATITDRQRLVAEKLGQHEAVYSFALPSDAAITNLEVKLAGGRVAKGTIVPTSAAVAKLDDAEAMTGKPDVALLREMDCGGPEELSCYELRVYPVETKGVEVRTTWIAPLRYTGGRLSLRIPGRGKTSRLVDASVRLEISAPDGAGGFTEIAGGGTILGRNVGAGKGRYSFKAASARDVVVDAAPWFPDDAILTSYAAAKIDENGGVLVVGLMAPPPKTSSIPKFARAIFVIDVSRSMQSGGILAARDLATAILAAIGKDVKIEVVLFDRKPRRVFGSFVANDKDARRKIEQALAIPAPANGSDLGAAIDQISPILAEARRKVDRDRDEVRGLGPDTLVVVMSDANAPVELDGDRARDRLGDETAEEVQVVGITIFPDGVEAPDPTANVLGALASRTGGRAVAVRDTLAGGVAKRIAADLTRPAPLTEARLATGTAWVDGLELPGELLPGEGVLALARVRGELPKNLVLTGYKASKEVAIEMSAAGVELSRAALPLWSARVRVDDFLDAAEEDAAPGTDAWKLAKRRLVAMATRARAVTPWTSFVAVDPDDQFARDRMAFVEKWGGSLYQRLPPPPEREAGRELKVDDVDNPPVAGRSTPQVKIGRPVASGTLDKAIIRRLVRTHVIPLAKACYDRALRKNDKLAGSLELVFEISTGEIVLASVEASTFGHAELEACVTDAIYAIDVPRVVETGREITLVRYPLTFVVEGVSSSVTDEVQPQTRQPDPNDPLEGILDGL